LVWSHSIERVYSFISKRGQTIYGDLQYLSRGQATPSSTSTMQKKHVPKRLGVGQDGLGSRKIKASQRVTQ
jgi:hypothetical protein